MLDVEPHILQKFGVSNSLSRFCFNSTKLKTNLYKVCGGSVYTLKQPCNA